MDILYLTDIHDNLKRLRHVLINVKADLYVISGDLLYRAFYTDQKLYQFVSLQEEFHEFILKNSQERGSTPSEIVLLAEENGDFFPPRLRDVASTYLDLLRLAASNMKDKYELLKNLVEKYATAPVIFLPGNYDMDLQFTDLHDYDIHRKSREFGHYIFSGYGGAPVNTPGIPELTSVEFVEGMAIDNPGEPPHRFCEAADFFKESHPDILILHNPAYGTLDRIASRGHIGSIGIRDYIDDHSPLLALSGHIHQDRGIRKVFKTTCINPSNFGAVDSTEGFDEGGFFCRITLSRISGNEMEKKIENVRWQRIAETIQRVPKTGEQNQGYRYIRKFEIKNICDVTPDINQGGWREEILDAAEFEIHGGFIR